MAVKHRQTLGNVLLLEVDASPNGSITAPRGSIASDSTNGNIWKNTDGSTTWEDLSAVPSGAVEDTDFNANTILKADSDDTPVALTVAEQTLVGRITSGSITALTATQVRTLLNVEDGADVTDATNVNAAGAVMETDYNANTILAATTDDTPVTLTVAEQTLVGRITSGNIAALTATQVRTLINVEDGADVTDETNVLAALTNSTTAKDFGGGDLTSVAEISQKDHAAFTGSETIKTTAAVQTTDATVTTLLSLALSDDSTYWVEAWVAARGTSAGENAYKVAALFSRRSAGGATLGGAGSINLFTDEEDLDWDVAWVASSNNAVLQVTGEAATTINWTTTARYQRVSGNT